jgi:NitT/TauT family transport system permease protein
VNPSVPADAAAAGGLAATSNITALTRRRRLPRSSVQLFSIVAGLGTWQLVASSGLVEPLFLPKLSDVLADLWNLISNGKLNQHLIASGIEFGVGMLLALVVGISVGIAMGASNTVDRLLVWWVSAFDATPRIAFAPLLIIWFGIGLESKMVLVFISGLFPILLSTASGVRTTSRELLEMANSFSVPRAMQFRAIILPGAVPFVITGVRLGITRGLIGIVVGEMIASTQGIGWMLSNASDTFNMVRVFSLIIVLAFVGVGLTTLARWLERRFDSWRAI